MEPVSIDPGLFNFDDGHPCRTYSPSDYDKQNWTNDALFKFDSNGGVVVVNFSNALPTHFTTADYQRTTAPLDLGDLHIKLCWLHFKRSRKQNSAYRGY